MTEGDIESMFYNLPNKENTYTLNTFGLELFNPKYHDLKAISLEISLGEEKEDGIWEENNTKITLLKFYKGRDFDGESNFVL